jgi:hypothetical protein
LVLNTDEARETLTAGFAHARTVVDNLGMIPIKEVISSDKTRN